MQYDCRYNSNMTVKQLSKLKVGFINNFKEYTFQLNITKGFVVFSSCLTDISIMSTISPPPFRNPKVLTAKFLLSSPWN